MDENGCLIVFSSEMARKWTDYFAKMSHEAEKYDEWKR